jgi:hypothetical protein
MSQIEDLLDRRNFSETVDAILYTRPRFTALFFPLFALAFFAVLGWLAFVPYEQAVHARGDVRVRGRAMEVEAFVAQQDIARVRPGLPARIELDAYPARQFGAVDGRVTFVAPDRDERGYRIRIALARPRSRRVAESSSRRVEGTPRRLDDSTTGRFDDGIELRAGLSGTVAVIGDRSPLYRAMGERLGVLR